MNNDLRKNDVFEAVVEGFSSDGGGVCRVNGRAVFVPRTLPGERWRVRVVKANRTAVWGRGEALLSPPSPDRTEPACPVFGRCGGCSVMHMDYACEKRFKLARLNDALARLGGLSLRAEEIDGADVLAGYRSKSVYNFAPGPVAGFYRARSHEVISSPRCLLQPPEFHAAAAALCSWMEQTGVPAYNEANDDGLVRHLYLRRSDGGFLACIVAAGTLPEGCAAALRAACPTLTGVLLCINKDVGNTVLTDDMHTLWGSPLVHERLCGAVFELSPLTFFQINTAQAQKLYRIAGQFADPAGQTVLDLYCGAGSIGLSVCRDAKKLIFSDVVPDAVENARKNAALNDVQNAEFLCGDAAQVAQDLADRGLKPDVIIVDPPRKGLDAAVIDAVCAMSPTRLVYVSCDPGTLARDLKLLTQKGYAPRFCRCVDMFPRTRHIETVCLLSKL